MCLVFVIVACVGTAGNMRHLIVEACISRNLLDTSAYLWPGFVIGGTNQVPQGIAGNISCWSLVMKGSPLTPSLTNSLITTPASRYDKSMIDLCLCFSLGHWFKRGTSRKKTIFSSLHVINTNSITRVCF